MKWFIMVFLLVAVIILAGCSSFDKGDLAGLEPFFYDDGVTSEPVPIPIVNDSVDSFTIANWNLQVFGVSKASRPEVMDFYVSKIKNYDIVFVQEIRDASDTAFWDLCSLMPERSCMVSVRDGRTSSKEQVGVIFDDKVEVLGLESYDDPFDLFERSPARVVFVIGNYSFTALNVHIKPDNASAEIDALDDLADLEDGNVLVLGDLNADCSYYAPYGETDFSDWYWVIADWQDTTVARTDCAYDRIIVNHDMEFEISDYGVDSDGINNSFSDHYIVYAEIVTRDV